MRAIRAGVKGIAEALLGQPALVRIRVAQHRSRRLILSYHNVIASRTPLVAGDRSLHLPLDSFRRQLDLLESLRLRVAPLDSPVEMNAPSVAITFDDAYAGTLTHGLAELRDRGLPCTMFVAPGLLGVDAPWWDRLADAAEGGVPPALRAIALEVLGGEGERILHEAAVRGWPLHAAIAEHRIATEGELDDAVRASPLLTLGAHTWSHPNIAVLPAERVTAELSRPLAWLRERYADAVIPWLAYPYGLESATARGAARAAGYRGALRVTGGWTSMSDDGMGLPRLNITPGITAAGFRLRLAGFTQ